MGRGRMLTNCGQLIAKKLESIDARDNRRVMKRGVRVPVGSQIVYPLLSR